MGTVPSKITLNLNGEKDEWGLMKAVRANLMEEAEDNLEWMTYMNAGSDFPRVKPSDWGKESYDEFYSNGLGSMSPDRVYKTKFSNKERHVWQEVGHYCSEVAVIENSDRSETMILLLATPFEITKETSRAFLVVLDGKDLSEIDRAYFPEEVKLPWMAHTTWVDVEMKMEPTQKPTDKPEVTTAAQNAEISTEESSTESAIPTESAPSTSSSSFVQLSIIYVILAKFF